ncbi:MAG: hypothetical protein ABIG66_02100 [Candidatus Kerfeldbacteria bacterium]
MKSVAGDANQEAPVVVPVVLEPVEVEVALVGVLVQVRHVAVAVGIVQGTIHTTTR